MVVSLKGICTTIRPSGTTATCVDAISPSPDRDLAKKSVGSERFPKKRAGDERLSRKHVDRTPKQRLLRKILGSKNDIRHWLAGPLHTRKRELERSLEVDEASLTKEEKIAKLECGIREDKKRLKVLREGKRVCGLNV